MKVASYFASLNITINQASIRNTDRLLKHQEKQFLAFSKRMQKALTLNIKLPPLKVKAFKIDELALQRNSQMALNRVSRLLQLPINNFVVDQSRLNRQVQGVMQRAANQASIRVKTIQGSSGGNNPFLPSTYTKRPAMPQPHMPAYNPSYRYRDSFAGSLSGASMALLPGRLAMFSGPALPIAAVAGGAYVAVDQSVDLGKEQAVRESQRVQLDIASAAPDRKTRDARNKQFFALSNKLGVEAQTLVDPYSKFLKQMQTMGRSYEQGFDLFKDMSIATRGSGGGQQQMERQAYA